jgi:hypothetical protein
MAEQGEGGVEKLYRVFLACGWRCWLQSELETHVLVASWSRIQYDRSNCQE